MGVALPDLPPIGALGPETERTGGLRATLRAHARTNVGSNSQAHHG